MPTSAKIAASLSSKRLPNRPRDTRQSMRTAAATMTASSVLASATFTQTSQT